MAFPYKKILCPIDFDNNSLQALDEAVAIARHLGASIALVHVVPMVLEFPDLPHTLKRYVDEEKGARAKLDKIVAQKIEGISYQSAIYVGDVVGCVLEAADKFDPDLLVTATHGREGVTHFFLGSVAEALVRKVKCPVLTVHAPGAGKRER